jgi:6-pyruvoyl-tetrahydropterin synthase
VIEIWTTITIEVAHSSPTMGVPQLHGHSYWLQFFAETDSGSNATSLAAMQSAAGEIRTHLDHRNLDEVMSPATMEQIVAHCVARWDGPRLTRVVVRRDSLGCGVEWRA